MAVKPNVSTGTKVTHKKSPSERALEDIAWYRTISTGVLCMIALLFVSLAYTLQHHGIDTWEKFAKLMNE